MTKERTSRNESLGTVVLLSMFVLLFASALFALWRLDAVYEAAQLSIERSIRAVLLDLPRGKPIDRSLDETFAALRQLEKVATRVELDLQRVGLERLWVEYRAAGSAGDDILDRFVESFSHLETNLAEKRRSISDSFYSLIALLSAFLVVSIAIGTGLGYRLRMSRLEADWSRRSLARSLEAEEALRRRIARELHDDAAQEVAAAKLLCERASEGDPGAAVRHCADAARLLSSAGRKIRGLALDLRPPELERTGLQSALESLCARHRDFDGRPVVFTLVSTLPRLSDDTSIHAFRIAQEALSNAAKHAPGNRIELRAGQSMEAGMEGVMIEVLDGAAGQDEAGPAGDRAGAADDPSMSSGMGLAIMMERAALVKGTLTAGRESGGFAVRLFVPAAAMEGART